MRKRKRTAKNWRRKFLHGTRRNMLKRIDDLVFAVFKLSREKAQLAEDYRKEKAARCDYSYRLGESVQKEHDLARKVHDLEQDLASLQGDIFSKTFKLDEFVKTEPPFCGHETKTIELRFVWQYNNLLCGPLFVLRDKIIGTMSRAIENAVRMRLVADCPFSGSGLGDHDKVQGGKG